MLNSNTPPTVEEMAAFLLPHLLTAGRYATRIQQRIQARPSKGGDNAFQQALTDADLSVQGFLEVVLLSRFPDIQFYSEEWADSLNAKYFGQDAAIEVLVDPIDGTRSYLDGASSFQIIITLRENRRMTGVLCHLPRQDHCYAALVGRSFRCKAAQMQAGLLEGEPVGLSDQSNRVLMFNAPEVKRALGPEFEVLDILEEFTERRVHHGFTEMLAGKAAACIHPRPQLIDAAAIAFVAQQAGGVLTDFAGQPLPFDQAADQRSSGLVVSASQAFHERILAKLKSLIRF